MGSVIASSRLPVPVVDIQNNSTTENNVSSEEEPDSGPRPTFDSVLASEHTVMISAFFSFMLLLFQFLLLILVIEVSCDARPVFKLTGMLLPRLKVLVEYISTRPKLYVTFQCFIYMYISEY